jgi:hypothetical protein
MVSILHPDAVLGSAENVRSFDLFNIRTVELALSAVVRGYAAQGEIIAVPSGFLRAGQKVGFRQTLDQVFRRCKEANSGTEVQPAPGFLTPDAVRGETRSFMCACQFSGAISRRASCPESDVIQVLQMGICVSSIWLWRLSGGMFFFGRRDCLAPCDGGGRPPMIITIQGRDSRTSRCSFRGVIRWAFSRRPRVQDESIPNPVQSRDLLRAFSEWGHFY